MDILYKLMIKFKANFNHGSVYSILNFFIKKYFKKNLLVGCYTFI